MKVSYEEALARGWISPEHLPKKSAASQKRAATTKQRKEAEGEEQAQLVAWFEATYPEWGTLLIHIPNGGSRKNAFEGWRLKQQGVRAGVSDLLLPVARGGFFGLWLEFKAAPPNDAAVSPPQREWVERMRSQGYQARVVLGVVAAQAALAEYLALPATKVSRSRKNSD